MFQIFLMCRPKKPVNISCIVSRFGNESYNINLKIKEYIVCNLRQLLQLQEQICESISTETHPLISVQDGEHISSPP